MSVASGWDDIGDTDAPGDGEPELYYASLPE